MYKSITRSLFSLYCMFILFQALERRFQQVYVDEPSPEDTVSILRGLKPKYEVHHGVRIRDEALLAAAKLSTRYEVLTFQVFLFQLQC